VHSVSHIRQIGIQTAKPLVPDPGHCEVKIPVANLKKCKLPSNNQIPAELQALLFDSESMPCPPGRSQSWIKFLLLQEETMICILVGYRFTGH
jgi:hypothetical protein